mmetsp:Transcript_844/g.1091  ORF Transcript_844/g.1091 Transcript_844/m.1091 type:complete len:93 (+) Transcript_844:139-417(+)|eukprot:jgi/Bigna1/65615/fgenesh1_kg.119_\
MRKRENGGRGTRNDKKKRNSKGEQRRLDNVTCGLTVSIDALDARQMEASHRQANQGWCEPDAKDVLIHFTTRCDEWIPVHSPRLCLAQGHTK